MAKKKKTALKPVARGFATTSVPKKVVEPVEDVVDSSTAVEDASTSDATASHQGNGAAPADSVAVLSAEEQALQSLTEKLQEKTEKEVIRVVKAVETDRRFAMTMPRLDLDSAYIDKIMELARDSSANDGDAAQVEGPEDKAIAKLGITYGVLRRLGFSEKRVEECLRAIRGIGLDEAYEWLYMNCTEEELLRDKPSSETDLKTPRTPRTPRIPRAGPAPKTPLLPSHIPAKPIKTSQETLTSPSVNLPGSGLDVNAATFVPSSARGLEPEPLSDEGSRPSMSSDLPNSSSSSLRNSPDNDDPHDQYVRLRMEIDALTRNRMSQESRDASHLENLKLQLAAVQEHYFFRVREAEALYKEARQAADAEALRSRLRGDVSSAEPRVRAGKKRPPELKSSAPDTATATVSDSDDSEGGEGMFALLENATTSEMPDGRVIPIRDLGAPKQWSGRTPKMLLAETVHKVDRHAVVTYANTSGHSRAKRATVSVRGDGGQSGTWAMDGIACQSEEQAEQYISMIALHALTYPPSDGFALGGTSAAGGGQTFFRLLPAVFRDLWDELEEKRKTEHDEINRAAWAKLQSILDGKLRKDKHVKDKSSQSAASAKDSAGRHHAAPHDLSPEQLVAGFVARYESHAYQEMLVQRNRLPIAQYRGEIISSLETSQVLVLSGETGCGKSTQLPAFILEDHLSQGKHCKIFCTEPRRISAISLAQRVAAELGDPPGSAGTGASIVGYSVRLESNIHRNTKLAYVTNGIALRMLENGSGAGGQGSAFDEITHIIIDEVHERTIESDFLLIVLKSLMFQRPDLRIVLMSATVDADKISQFFGGCPTLHVPGRTFPVDTRYLEDAVELTGWSVAEGSQYARRVNDKFYRNKARSEWAEEAATAEEDDTDVQHQDVKLEKRYSDKTAATINMFDERLIPYDLVVRVLERVCFEDPQYELYSAAILVFMPGLGEIRRLNDTLLEHPMFGDPSRFRVLPLHSTVSSEGQGAVFDIPAPGMRKIVIATNIAETGITIPDITCVIDTGKHREMRFDEKRQLSRLVETFVAKSNAAQRRGRAGRVQNGLCFHLFTKIRHDTLMADHPQPEMLRLSLSDLALRIKIMRVQIGTSIEDVLGRALDPPSAVNIQRAVSALVEVRALTPHEDITPMGRLLSKLPTDVHLGKFLLIATVFRCLDPALTIAASLNAKSPFVVPFGKEDMVDAAKANFRTENSDFLTLHNVFASWRRASANGNQVHKFCRQNFLSHQNLQQIEELRQQFLGYLIDASFIQVDRSFARDLSRARYSRSNRVRLVDVPDHLNSNANSVHLLNAALAAGLYPKILSIDSITGTMRTISNNQAASFHPTSVNHRRKPQDLGVHHLSFFTLMQSKRMYAWETGPVDDVALLLLCGEGEFKYIADSTSIDRKIRFQVPGKTAVALKHLRSRLASVLALQFRGEPLTESQILWKELAEMVLAKVKPVVEDESRSRSGTVVIVNPYN